MSAGDTHLAGELKEWPSMNEMVSILRSAGLRVYVGRYSIRVEDFSHFVFAQYGGDLGCPIIDADADSPEALAGEAARVSNVLAQAGLIHRFEIYGGDGELCHYLHHGWPQTTSL